MGTRITIYSLYVLLLLSAFRAYGQEEDAVVYHCKKYIQLNVKAEEKYHRRVQRQQDRVLRKLSKKEKRYARNLKRNDSAAYVKYTRQQPTYDSIAKISKAKTKQPPNVIGRSNTSIDSIRNVKKFAEDRLHVTGDGINNTAFLDQYSPKLDNLKAQNDKQEQIGRLIDQRTNSLKGINGGTKNKIAGFKGIASTSYYGKQKIKAFKEIKEEPSRAEEKVLEFLQGQQGFESYLNDNQYMQELAAMSTSDLEKMGIPTKRVMNQHLQRKFGNALPDVQQKMGGQIADFNDKAKAIKTKTREVKQHRQSAIAMRNTAKPKIEKPVFRINPMRGKPFMQRLEPQFNWQITRATLDGKPAIFNPAAMIGFRHTPRLTYGIGASTAIGLGKNWDQIQFSFQGLGFRTFINHNIQYGIGMYCGYERTYRRAAFDNNAEGIPNQAYNSHNTRFYDESLLAGLTKKYAINDKWNGSIQVLYDVWWKEKGLKHPIQLRFATLKK